MFFWQGWNKLRGSIDLDPIYTEVVTPERLIEMYKGDRDNIESVKVIPGRLGTNDFGRFVVQRKRPLYVPSLDEALTGR